MKYSPFRTAAATCAAVAIAVSALGAGPAHATGAGLSPADRSAMRATWDAHGVKSETQDRLVDALEGGEMWDSLSGGDPTSTRTTTDAGSVVTVDTFADGSIRVNTMEKTVDPESRAAIGGCRTLASSHYDASIQCNVSTNVVVSSAAYVVVYNKVQGGNSTIKSVTPLTASCYGGSCGSKSVTIHRKTQSGNAPAYSTGRWKWTAVNGAGSKDFWLEFDVRGSSTWAANN